jgi:hypothetical protein
MTISVDFSSAKETNQRLAFNANFNIRNCHFTFKCHFPKTFDYLYNSAASQIVRGKGRAPGPHDFHAKFLRVADIYLIFF